MTEPPDRRVLIINPVGAPRSTRKIRLALARIIHGNTAIEVQPFRNEGKAVVP